MRDLKWFRSLRKRDFDNGAVLDEIDDVFRAVKDQGDIIAQLNDEARESDKELKRLRKAMARIQSIVEKEEDEPGV